MSSGARKRATRAPADGNSRASRKGPWTNFLSTFAKPRAASRSTAATFMLEDGTPLKVVSEILGHASVATTADLYMHVTPSMQAEAARARGKLWA